MACNPKRKSATVTFNEHRAARRAKEKGRTVHSSLPPVQVSYSQQSPRADKLRPARGPELPLARPAPPPAPRKSTAKTDISEMSVVTNTVTGEGQQSQAQLLAIMKQVIRLD